LKKQIKIVKKIIKKIRIKLDIKIKWNRMFKEEIEKIFCRAKSLTMIGV